MVDLPSDLPCNVLALVSGSDRRKAGQMLIFSILIVSKQDKCLLSQKWYFYAYGNVNFNRLKAGKSGLKLDVWQQYLLDVDLIVFLLSKSDLNVPSGRNVKLTHSNLSSQILVHTTKNVQITTWSVYIYIFDCIFFQKF